MKLLIRHDQDNNAWIKKKENRKNTNHKLPYLRIFTTDRTEKNVKMSPNPSRGNLPDLSSIMQDADSTFESSEEGRE